MRGEANIRTVSAGQPIHDEAQTRIQLIDPALHARGWNEEMIKREETLGTVEVVGGRPRRQPIGRTDYTRRIKVASDAQPVAIAVLEAKGEDKHPEPVRFDSESADRWAGRRRPAPGWVRSWLSASGRGWCSRRRTR